MDRTDSAFDQNFHPKPSRSTTHHARKNKSSTKKERHAKNQSLPTSSNDPTAMKTNPQATKTPPSPQGKTPDLRRKSITSTTTTSTSTNKSRKRTPGSVPSSRRTSCTVIDPSRPTRQYRIKSSQTCPTFTTDIDDVLALHFRSCSLFQNPTYQQSSSLPNSPPHSSGGRGDGLGHGLGVRPPRPPPPPPKRAATTDFAPAPAPAPTPQTSCPGTAPPHLILTSPPPPTTTTTTTTITTPSEPSPSPTTDHTAPLLPPSPPPTTTTTMHWMSPTTRRTQYAAIDRDNTGVRGFVRRILPRCVAGPSAVPFYEKDGADAGSVRRYRMDVDVCADGEGDEVHGEKGMGMGMRKEREKRWGCF